MEAPTGCFCFPEISICVVFKPWGDLVLRRPLKKSQEGRTSQTVSRFWQAVAQEVWGLAPGPQASGGPADNPSTCAAAGLDFLMQLS